MESRPGCIQGQFCLAFPREEGSHIPPVPCAHALLTPPSCHVPHGAMCLPGPSVKMVKKKTHRTMIFLVTHPKHSAQATRHVI